MTGRCHTIKVVFKEKHIAFSCIGLSRHARCDRSKFFDQILFLPQRARQ